MKNRRPLFDKELGTPGMPTQGTPKLDAFGNARGNPFDPVLSASPEEARAQAHQYDNAVPVLLPRHLYAPEGARTIEMFVGVDPVPGVVTPMLSFTCPPGATVVFYAYQTGTDSNPGGPGIFREWIPKVDGRKVLEYHGVPTNTGFKIRAPLNGDMAVCQIIMEPGQTLTWEAIHNYPAPIHMTIRMRGYLDRTQKLVSSKFGD